MTKTSLIQSLITGGHYSIVSPRNGKIFQNHMNICKKIKIKPTDVVVDIGAFVGEYSLLAWKNGAHSVFSYEPTPETFSVLKKNTDTKENIKIFNVAVTGTGGKPVKLFVSSGIGVTNSIVKSRGKSRVIHVPTISYADAVKKASVVKIDVEAAEYDYDIVQPSLRAIILEFHPITGKPWKNWAFDIICDIQRAGFKPVHMPGFKHGWDLTGCWERD